MIGFETLKKVSPVDARAVKAILDAPVVFKDWLVQDIPDKNFGRGVEEVNSVEQYEDAISVPGEHSTCHLPISETTTPGIRYRYLISLALVLILNLTMDIVHTPGCK